MEKSEHEKRRSKIEQYIVFSDELRVSQSGLKNLKKGDKFAFEENSDIAYEVIKVTKIQYLGQEFIFVKEI